MKNNPIGIYDSGIGGLTVLKTLREKMPNENFVYFADTANLPYGNKSPQQILDFSHNIISWFQNEIGAKLVIAACHTSSSLALDKIKHDFHIPVIGTIYPLVNGVLNNAAHNNIGIIATQASINSRMHETMLQQHGFSGKITSIACPDFVPLLESHEINHSALKTAAHDYLSAFKDAKLDTLIYGCTHYPFVKYIIEEILPVDVHHLDPAHFIATEACDYLTKTSQLNDTNKNVQTDFYCSKEPKAFATKLTQLYGIKNPNVKLLNLNQVGSKL